MSLIVPFNVLWIFEMIMNIVKFAILPMVVIIIIATALVSLWYWEYPSRDNVELVILITLIITELYMLIMMNRERLQRVNLEKSLVDTRHALGRENYLSLIRQCIEQANEEVLFTTRSMTTPEKEPLMTGIINVSASKRRKRGFSHRGIIAPRSLSHRPLV